MSHLADSFDVCDVLPEDHTALSVAVCIKALDQDGDVVLVNYRSSDLSAWEAAGMLEFHREHLLAELRSESTD